MHSGTTWRLGHRPGLDGLRGVAIGLVLLGHSHVPGFPHGGGVGVALFFVLSGFLITALLLEEHERGGRIDLRAFYMRRVRRLAPAFLACFVLACVLASAVAVPGFLTVRDALLSVSYVGNWYPALHHGGGVPLGILSGTWSLAVEEQFYVVWPGVLILALRGGGSRRVGQVAALGAMASLGVRLVLDLGGASWTRIYYGTDTSAVGLLVGVLLAVTLMRSPMPQAPRWLLPVALVGLALDSLVAATWMILPIVGCAAVAVYCLGVGQPGRSSWLAPAWLVWLGRRSYAVYLWNCLIAAALVWVAPMPWPVRTLVVVIPALVLAELSWRFVESPFLRRRSGDRVERARILPGGVLRSDPVS